MFVGAKITLWGNVSWSKCREQIMRHGSDPCDVCVVQGRSVVVTWAGSGQVKVQKKQANVKDIDYVITPYRSLAERDRPPVWWYHHPRRLQCVLSRNLIIFKVATWHYRCRHNLKNYCIWDNLQCCLLVPRSPGKPVMLTFDLQSRKVLFVEVFWHV